MYRRALAETRWAKLIVKLSRLRDKHLAALLATKKADNINKIRKDIQETIQCYDIPKLEMKVDEALNQGMLDFVEELKMLDDMQCDIIKRQRCV